MRSRWSRSSRVVDVRFLSDGSEWESAKRLALQTRDELDLALAKASAPDETMSDEQLLAIMVQAVASLPAQHLERLEDAIAIRRGASPVRLVETA